MMLTCSENTPQTGCAVLLPPAASSSCARALHGTVCQNQHSSCDSFTCAMYGPGLEWQQQQQQQQQQRA